MDSSTEGSLLTLPSTRASQSGREHAQEHHGRGGERARGRPPQRRFATSNRPEGGAPRPRRPTSKLQSTPPAQQLNPVQIVAV